MRTSAIAAVVSVALGATSAQAISISDIYSTFWVLGDSLSDNGNLYAATSALPGVEATPPVPPYFGGAGPYRPGQISNGPVWADLIAKTFPNHELATGNVAWGGAKAETDTSGPLDALVPDLAEQVEVFKVLSAGRLGVRPLVSLWFGNNDTFSLVESAVTDVTPQARDLAGLVVDGLDEIADTGVDDLLVFNLPDLSLIPRYNLPDPSLTPEAQAVLRARAEAAVRAFNDELMQGVGDVSANVTVVDIFALVNDLFAEPGIYGVSNVDVPCFIPGVFLCTDPGERAFWDPNHPSAEIHAALAEEVRAALAPAPIPVPASLPLAVGGVAVLAFVGGRRLRGRR